MGLIKTNKGMTVIAGDYSVYNGAWSSISIYSFGNEIFRKKVVVKIKGSLRLKFNLRITPSRVFKLVMIKNDVETTVFNQTIAVENSTFSYDFKVNVNDTFMFKAYRADDSYVCEVKNPLYGVSTPVIEGNDA